MYRKLKHIHEETYRKIKLEHEAENESRMCSHFTVLSPSFGTPVFPDGLSIWISRCKTYLGACMNSYPHALHESCKTP